MERTLLEWYVNQERLLSLRQNPAIRGRKSLEMLKTFREFETNIKDYDEFRKQLLTKYELGTELPADATEEQREKRKEQQKQADAEFREAGNKKISLTFDFTLTEPEIVNANITTEQIEELIAYGLFELAPLTKKEIKKKKVATESTEEPETEGA